MRHGEAQGTMKASIRRIRRSARKDGSSNEGVISAVLSYVVIPLCPEIGTLSRRIGSWEAIRSYPLLVCLHHAGLQKQALVDKCPWLVVCQAF